MTPLKILSEEADISESAKAAKCQEVRKCIPEIESNNDEQLKGESTETAPEVN